MDWIHGAKKSFLQKLTRIFLSFGTAASFNL